MSDEDKNNVDVKNNKKQSSNNLREAAFFEAGIDDNILDRAKRSLAKLSWFQRLFK